MGKIASDSSHCDDADDFGFPRLGIEHPKGEFQIASKYPLMWALPPLRITASIETVISSRFALYSNFFGV